MDTTAHPTTPTAHATPPHPPVAVITGASRGLGLELARALAADGWHLVITARTATELAVAEAELATRTTVVALPGTVVDDDHRAELAAAASRLGGAALLINNASTLNGAADEWAEPLPALATIPLPDLLETFEVNVLAPIALSQLVLPQLRRRGGAVLNISSDAAVEAYPGWGGYGAAKAALDHASAVLAEEEPELRVWAVDPGDLRTRLHQQACPDADLSELPPPSSVVPAFRTLWQDRPASGRYRAADLAAPADLTAHTGLTAHTDPAAAPAGAGAGV
ncbi:SDR family NAD(P)-dependent oxidoreductase [Kitasatospora kifunensis]|uniref:NAD(P)-dependent dehydrogenase (Short-subunit alcohol dehydrogenase family) n=1 Tax=Kitasatospora kifunensis TaxID=58351 RepID=A0A7W7VY70_KITKI|nr:SDR family NAD(P)-dependent oxidoreductase [Kitasatospora kifunensis]MBB4926728.1 NAD(P)-dependent dehydrogenase (short-subunit alcohol dehydrogenase family) [Kitasatospora kifunensis]